MALVNQLLAASAPANLCCNGLEKKKIGNSYNLSSSFKGNLVPVLSVKNSFAKKATMPVVTNKAVAVDSETVVEGLNIAEDVTQVCL